MKFSVSESWWGSSPIWRDKIIDPHSKNVTAVPWDAASYLFLGAVDDSSALLLKKPPADALNDTVGPISAIDRQGKTLWSTADSYWNAFFDPMQPDILIGYQTNKSSDDVASTPHFINITTGKTIAQLPLSNGLIVCTDGVVTFTGHFSDTGHFSESETVTARAFSFTGEPRWEQKIGNCRGVSFDGTPPIDVVRRSLTELTGMEAVVAENGVAVTIGNKENKYNHSHFVLLRKEDGSSSSPEIGGINFFNILADGSEVLGELEEDDIDHTYFIDVATGKSAHRFEPSFYNVFICNQSGNGVTSLYSLPLPGRTPNRMIIDTSKGMICYVPKK